MACSSGETLFPAPNQRVFEESALQGTSAAPWAQPRVVKTIQADVGPGNKTGIYYITVCNLPFGTSWQGLKDFIRDVCKVDHVQVFDTSTSGWVRLCGRHNFEKAWGEEFRPAAPCDARLLTREPCQRASTEDTLTDASSLLRTGTGPSPSRSRNP
jgi:hypothetical protein